MKFRDTIFYKKNNTLLETDLVLVLHGGWNPTNGTVQRSNQFKPIFEIVSRIYGIVTFCEQL